VIGTAQPRPRPVPVELTHDPRFRRRVVRLAAVSAVALGLVWGLAVTTLDVPTAVEWALAAGWLLMPTLLLGSLSLPRLRYGLVVPASLVSLGLLAVVVGRLPGEPAAAAGWLLMTAGIWFGGALGLWLWYRLMPVPDALDDPFSAGRWALIALHVSLVVTGIALAATALW
jgi:hypothetical protein